MEKLKNKESNENIFRINHWIVNQKPFTINYLHK